MAQMWLSQHPLKNAGVFPTSRKKITVIMEKGNVGHMAAMPTIDMAGSLRIMGKKNVLQSTIWLNDKKKKKKKNSPLAGNRG